MDTTTISELSNKTPTGNMFTVIEDGGSTGKTTIDDFVAAAEIIGKSNMGTTAQTITGAIAEHENDISEMRQTISEHADDIQSNADAIGDLSGLNTVAHDSIVSAINEVNANTNTNASDIATNAAAISSLNSNLENNVHSRKTIWGGSILSTDLPPGAYYVVNGTDTPSGVTGAGFLTIDERSGYSSIRRVIFSPYNGNKIYINTRVVNETGWNGWKALSLTTV